MLRNLPENSTVEDIHYHLCVMEEFKRGQDDISSGRRLTQKEACERLRHWPKHYSAPVKP